MEIIVCPYCECKINMNDVDDEGGVCPECGALITGSLLKKHEEDLEDLDDLDDLEAPEAAPVDPEEMDALDDLQEGRTHRRRRRNTGD